MLHRAAAAGEYKESVMYVWVNGQFVPERLHHHWVTARCEQRGPKRYFEDGRWESDDETTHE